MKRPTHRLIAASVAVGAAAVTNMPPERGFALVVGSYAFAMLPDQAEKGVGRRLPPVARVPLVAALAAPFAALGGPWAALAAALAIGAWPHRGPVTHDPFVTGPLLLAPVAALSGWWALAATACACGAAAHLLADGATIHGLPAWPLRDRVWVVPADMRVRTGSQRERALAALVAVGLAVYCARLAGVV